MKILDMKNHELNLNSLFLHSDKNQFYFNETKEYQTDFEI